MREDLIRCLHSIGEDQPGEEFEIIVIDNASTDGTVDAVKTDFPRVVTVVNSENRGFAAANNQGIQKSEGEYILFLNPDTIVHPNSLDILVRFMDDNEDVGACGPKLLNEDGTVQASARRFPTFRGALYRHTAFRLLRIFRGQYKKWLMKDFGYAKQMDVEQLMGSALMVRRAVIDKVGGMDEEFFMYYEEVDLCYRIKDAGWRVVFVPEAAITHLGGRSTGQIPVRKRIMAIASLLEFFRRHRGKFATGLFSCVFKPAIIVRDVIDVATGAVTYIFAVVTLDKKGRGKSAEKLKNSTILLLKYSWRLLFKM